MSDKKRTYGQFHTPPDVADLLLAFCQSRPEDRLLDPSCGNGAFLSRAAQKQDWLDPGQVPPDTLWGVELDPESAAQAREALPQANILNRNFFELDLWTDHVFGADETESIKVDAITFDAIVGNPPYTRAEWIGRLPETVESVHQLSMFNGVEKIQAPGQYAHQEVLTRRSGLHAYFFVHGTEFLRESGRFGFVVPNSWLDVAYGERLKQFLLDHYRIVAIIESNVERWFSEAKVNTCLVVLEKCGDVEERATNLVRLVRFGLPLARLIDCPLDDPERLSALERLVTRLMPEDDKRRDDLAVRVVSQRDLSAAEKWGVALRAPAVYRRRSRKSGLFQLGTWAMIHRGYTTGANAFFYLDTETVDDWEIEPEFRRPLLKSLRHVDGRSVTDADCEHQVLTISSYANLKGTATARYIACGESKGYHRRRTCASRQPWYSLPEQDEAQLLMPKGIWERHFASVLMDEILTDQQLYRIRLADGIHPMAAAALLNSAWFALQAELHGRVNFGEGVLWLANYELAELRLPDPRYLPVDKVDGLIDAFERLLDWPVATVQEELALPAWHAFNGAVFEVLGFSALEAGTVVEALLERLATRRMKATRPT